MPSLVRFQNTTWQIEVDLQLHSLRMEFTVDCFPIAPTLHASWLERLLNSGLNLAGSLFSNSRQIFVGVCRRASWRASTPNVASS